MSPVSEKVIWHDVECGHYDADVALWRELAAAAHGPILDVGAGTGRVTLDLARRGHEVVALDIDPALLAELELRARAEGLNVRTVVADAGDFSLERRDFALVMAPMQTVHLLRPAGRLGFLRCARSHVAPGGHVAIAIVETMEAFDDTDDALPLPDHLLIDGTLYSSQPVALRDHGDSVVIERIRQIVPISGQRRASDDILRLDRVAIEQVEAEARAANLLVLPGRIIGQTEDYVGTTVVMLRG